MRLASFILFNSSPGARDRILRLRRQRQAVITGSVGVEPLFPELLQATAGMDTAQSQDVFRSRFAPEHAGLLAAGANDRLASGLDDARADEEALAAEGAILHAFHVVEEVTQFLFHRIGLRLAGAFFASLGNELLHLVLEQLPGPAAQSALVVGMFFAA